MNATVTIFEVTHLMTKVYIRMAESQKDRQN